MCGPSVDTFLAMAILYYSGAIIFFLFFSVYCENAAPQNPLESQMLLLLEKWRTGRFDSDILPLPSLRSVKIPDVEYSYDQKGIKMTYILRKMELTGLETFSIKKLTVFETATSIYMSISFNIPKLTLYAENYELKGRAYLMYPLKGSGNMTVIFRDSDFTLKINFMSGVNGISTRIKDFQFDFNVYQIQGNLVGSSWPINKVLNSEGVEILATHHDDIVQAMWDYVVPYMDHHLVNVSILQIADMLLNITL